MSTTSRLGELLVRESPISLAELQRAQEEERRTGARLGYSLTKLGILDPGHRRRGLSHRATRGAAVASEVGAADASAALARLVELGAAAAAVGAAAALALARRRLSRPGWRCTRLCPSTRRWRRRSGGGAGAGVVRRLGGAAGGRRRHLGRRGGAPCVSGSLRMAQPGRSPSMRVRDLCTVFQRITAATPPNVTATNTSALATPSAHP